MSPCAKWLSTAMTSSILARQTTCHGVVQHSGRARAGPRYAGQALYRWQDRHARSLTGIIWNLELRPSRAADRAALRQVQERSTHGRGPPAVLPVCRLPRTPRAAAETPGVAHWPERSALRWPAGLASWPPWSTASAAPLGRRTSYSRMSASCWPLPAAAPPGVSEVGPGLARLLGAALTWRLRTTWRRVVDRRALIELMRQNVHDAPLGRRFEVTVTAVHVDESAVSPYWVRRRCRLSA